ncbi:transposable element Tcb2 transposase [Trichonephila clavipes]|nr:transposable element Tcb2 transposase [Trichonephila clavipes]
MGAGHLARMNEDRCYKKIFLANRPRCSRLLLRRIACVEKDLKILKVKNRKTVAESRDAWRRPKPTKGSRALEEEADLHTRTALLSNKLLGAVDTRREDRRILWQALVEPTVTRSTIRADVSVAIVPQIISRHLAEANLKSKRLFRALPLTPEHRQLRLQSCQARSMWNITDWQKVVFCDESRFVLGTDDNRVRVWRRSAYDSRSTLIVIRGILRGQRYVDDILRPYVGPLLNGLPEAIFQQDNARPHTARVAQDFLRPWPARSSDLSPVEHVWDQLKRQMPSCHSVHDLELAVQDLWAHLPQDNIRCLINLMPDRVAACIAVGGGPTRY